MADTVKRVDYYSTEMADNPGEGFRILAGLKQAGVNLLVYTGFPVKGGMAQLDFIPQDDGKLRQVATKIGLKLSEPKRAFLVQGEDHVGAVADMIGKLANEEINIVACQALCAGSGRWAMILWVKPTDYDRAAMVLGA